MAEDLILEVENLNKRYNKRSVLEDISFGVYKGEFLSLLGPSGCGKTTLLRLIIGIESPTSGEIKKNGVSILNNTPYERNIGLVFQNYSLFPNMNVYQNIAYALQTKQKYTKEEFIEKKKQAKEENVKVKNKYTKEEIHDMVMEMIDIVGLNEHIYKKPRQLSGGQCQRVAIARTLVLKPDIILFDEPMSALDADIKVVLRQLIKDIQKKYDITMIYVTHDQEEAFALSDRVMVLNESRIAQLDTPYNIYHNPANDFVKRFVVDHLDLKIKSIEDSIKNDNKELEDRKDDDNN